MDQNENTSQQGGRSGRLVLTRRLRERVFIDGGRIVVEVVEIGRGRVQLLIEAPHGMAVDREEVHERKEATRG